MSNKKNVLIFNNKFLFKNTFTILVLIKIIEQKKWKCEINLKQNRKPNLQFFAFLLRNENCFVLFLELDLKIIII